MNQMFIDILNICVDKLECEGDKSLHFKLKSFNKAIHILETIPQISSKKNIIEIGGIGKGIKNRLVEILETGHLNELTDYLHSKKTKNIQNKTNVDEDKSSNIIHDNIIDLCKVTGIGLAKARILANKGWSLSLLLQSCKNPYKSAQLLKDKIITHHQYLGAKYFNDLETKIPRKEIDKHYELLSYLTQLYDSKLSIQILGSYRRKNSDSGDIDVLLNHTDFTTKDQCEDFNHVLPQFVTHLKEHGFIVDHLTDGGSTKYMGFCKLSNNNSHKILARRIDIRFIHNSCKGASQLYFTGPGEFNKRMRTYAISLKYKINEYGLWKKEGRKLVFCESSNNERGIFKELNIEWTEPEDREHKYFSV